MSRKGRLTTKGKHALILALTIAACVTAMLFSLLLSVLCDGKYVSSAAHAGDISHPALITGKQRQDTDLFYFFKSSLIIFSTVLVSSRIF